MTSIPYLPPFRIVDDNGIPTPEFKRYVDSLLDRVYGPNGSVMESTEALESLAQLSTTGIVVRNTADSYTTRQITAATSRVTVTFGDGISGNPAIDVDEAEMDLANIGGEVSIGQIADFGEEVDDRVAGLLVAGAGITLNYDDTLNTLTVSFGLADGQNIPLGTVTGTKIGTGASQRLGFWNATPVVQPSGADQAALTNSTGGTADGTLAAVGDTSASDQSGVINDNFTELFTLLHAIRTALTDTGIIKGGA